MARIGLNQKILFIPQIDEIFVVVVVVFPTPRNQVSVLIYRNGLFLIYSFAVFQLRDGLGTKSRPYPSDAGKEWQNRLFFEGGSHVLHWTGKCPASTSRGKL